MNVSNDKNQIMMHPGMNYTFPGQYVTEYPMMQGGGQMSINDIKNAYKIAANNYNNRVFPEETLQKRQAAYNTINPTDYTDLRNYGRWLADEQRDVYSDPRSEESWKFYLGLTKPEDLKYLKKSQYRPTINATQKNYYSVDPELEQDIFNSYKDKVNLNQTLQTNESEIETPISGKGAASALGRFGVSRGHDDKGDYVSYYDKYDLKDFAQKRAMGVPYSIYGRIYYPKKEKGGEMIKRADGSYSRRGLWDNIRAAAGSGEKPTAQMLEQEHKIRNKYQQGGVIVNAGGEQHRIYVKTTNRGEGDKGHIMVNHPTMDKGMWDTIDLTQKAGATTIAQGVAATKEWHRENPYMKEFGGDVPMYANGGGIPERYKNMGFTHVGQKKQGDGKHKWKVLAKKGDQYKVVQGGWRGMQDFKQHHSQQRKENFWNRMGGRNSSKATDPFSPLYWHKRLGTWENGGQPMAIGGQTMMNPVTRKDNRNWLEFLKN